MSIRILWNIVLYRIGICIFISSFIIPFTVSRASTRRIQPDVMPSKVIYSTNFSLFFKDNQYAIYQHGSLQDRIEAASILAEQVPNIPVYADLMDNHVNKAFGAMPERLFILLDSKVVYAGGMGPFFYNLNDVKAWLENFVAN